MFVVIAVVLGILASFLAVNYVEKQVAARTPVNNTKTATVVVPSHPMKKGDIIKADDVAAREVPLDFIPADAIHPAEFQAYVGQQLRSDVAQGAPFSASAVDLVTDHFSNVINPGDVAYTIQVDDNNSISGLMVPGDHVDILLLVSDGEKARLMPLQSNVAVLATGKRARGVQGNDSGSTGFSNVTLELAPQDAQRVAMAGKAGELRVMLRKSGNNEPFNLQSLSKADLLKVGTPVRKGSGIEFIIGTKT
ncbi:Flp pilus assembly protein CpaB [Pinirhizobacter sp.]|jgi:pilus assembly protein CpaB|uniref:Flp pilus assembly protein CpaB n=1 Tax=Pinirhizobacter sp. TaxID=2950432 RepID=UPI002F4016ED